MSAPVRCKCGGKAVVVDRAAYLSAKVYCPECFRWVEVTGCDDQAQRTKAAIAAWARINR